MYSARRTASTVRSHSQALPSRQPVKKEMIGDFKNNGVEWQPEGQPEEVRAKDFLDKRLGKVEFATETIRRWWKEMGRPTYRGARQQGEKESEVEKGSAETHQTQARSESSHST